MDNFCQKTHDKYGFLHTKYTLYSDSWPELEVMLTNEQMLKLNSITNLQALISICETYANQKHFPNAGIIGSTKINFSGNILVIKGSLTVIELLLQKIFI